MHFTLISSWQQKLVGWAKDQRLLIESFFVAISLHVALLPILWVIGWALPWPKAPVITTVVEYELKTSQLIFRPKKVIEFRDPKLNQ